MNLTEATALLAVCSAFDNREASEPAARAWQAVLDDVPFDDAKDAVLEHYRRDTAWMMPAHVTQFVTERRRVMLEDRYREQQRLELASYRIPEHEKPTGPTQAFLDAKAVLVRAGNVAPAEDSAAQVPVVEGVSSNG